MSLGLFPGPTRLFFSRQGRETEDKGTRVVSSILACCFQASSCTSSSHPRSIPSRCPRSSQSLHIRSPPIEGRLVRIDLFFFPSPARGIDADPLSAASVPPSRSPLSAFSGHGRGRVPPPMELPRGERSITWPYQQGCPSPGGRRRQGGGGRERAAGEGTRPPLPVSSSSTADRSTLTLYNRSRPAAPRQDRTPIARLLAHSPLPSSSLLRLAACLRAFVRRWKGREP